jgi:acyl dehydratase
MSAAKRVIHSTCVGTRLGPVFRTLNKRSLMSYAAAINATDDVYLDDQQAHGIIGFPPFIVSPEWEIMNGTSYREALGLGDAGMWSCIHVQQDSRFFMPLVPSMRIVTEGVVSELRATRIGTFVATHLTTTEAVRGALVAESWFCGIFLNHSPDGENRCIASAPALQKLDADQFKSPPESLLTVTKALPHLYTEASSIWNPIHTELSEAVAVGLDSTLLHGTCTWAAAGLFLIRRVGSGDPQRLRHLAGRMAGKALVGSELAIQWDLSAMDGGRLVVKFQVVDSNGVLMIADGHAEFSDGR